MYLTLVNINIVHAYMHLTVFVQVKMSFVCFLTDVTKVESNKKAR